MKRSLGFLTVGAVAAAAMVGLVVLAGCDTDPEDPPGGSAGGGSGGDGGSDDSGTGNAAGIAGTGSTAGQGGSSCYTGQVRSVEDIANTLDEDSAVEINGAIATTKPILTYFNKDKLSCLWTVFVRDPVANRGLMVFNYGENAPTNDQTTCPKAGGFIPFDIVPGDVLTIVGKTSVYGFDNPKQRQVQACLAEKTGTAPVVPVVVSDLNGIAQGKPEYQNLLVKIENVTIETYRDPKTGKEYPANGYGDIALQGTNLVVKNSFYYRELGSGTWDKAQHFDYIIGIVHSNFGWVLQPRNPCADFSPQSSKNCP